MSVKRLTKILQRILVGFCNTGPKKFTHLDNIHSPDAGLLIMSVPFPTFYVGSCGNYSCVNVGPTVKDLLETEP